ncbi:uncharacterized protein [Rutidosis leptorrhynchoides]|uniref:uncharacterized protein n=1 Tax=Rutidosis leptorrhynchoides TaxID=125765 RepID=UPI003A9A07CF
MPEVSGQMAKWAVELGEHEINFSSRSAVKGQIFADYLVELPADVEASSKHHEIPALILTPWELYTDDACSAEGAGAGVILTGPGGEEHSYALRFNFTVTNNEGEYEALLAGMRITQKLEIKILHAYVDSKLVCSQINGDFEAHDEAMRQYLSPVHNLADQFEAFQVSHVMRGQNKKANALSKLDALAFNHLGKRGLIEELHAKSIVMMPLVAPVKESSSTWMTPIIAFLKDGTVPADSADAKKVVTKAPIDNGTQITGNPFHSWCEELNIKQTFTSVAHPQANGQCEVTNRDIVAGIKARLGHCRIGWVDELPKVLWENRTTPKPSTGETLFSLVYGTEAVVPTEIGNDASHAEDTGKLGPRWEGPYRVVGASNTRAYPLATLDGKPVKRT